MMFQSRSCLFLFRDTAFFLVSRSCTGAPGLNLSIILISCFQSSQGSAGSQACADTAKLDDATIQQRSLKSIYNIFVILYEKYAEKDPNSERVLARCLLYFLMCRSFSKN